MATTDEERDFGADGAPSASDQAGAGRLLPQFFMSDLTAVPWVQEVGPRGREPCSVVRLVRLHLDFELFRPIADNSLEPFGRIADAPRSSLAALHIAINMFGQD